MSALPRYGFSRRRSGKIPFTGLVTASCAALALAFSTAGTATAASPAADADGAYCVVNLSDPAQERVCFHTSEEVAAYTSEQDLYELVTVYDWIGHNNDGPYTRYRGEQPCSSTTSDVDYVRDTLYGKEFTLSNPNGVIENNAYSSVITHNQCDIRLSDLVNNNPDGDRSGWIDNCTHLDGSGQGDCPAVQSWYDRASSFQLS